MEIVYGTSGGRLEQILALLREAGLDWDENIETTVNLWEDGMLCATGSRQGNVLKCIAVVKQREGQGLTATVVTQLVKDALTAGHPHLFLFTKPGNADKFSELGFYSIAETADITMLENRKNGIQKFVGNLDCPTREGIIGAIVANCNPFTNGHRYLMETAANQCDLVHIFILSEDRSSFSAKDRMMLVRQGTADLANVVIHPTSDYLISSVTFPDYFIKDKVQAKAIHCELDLIIFAERFAKPLGITRRYVGSEPTDAVTAAYNQQMHSLLPRFGIRVVELPRWEQEGSPISASTVRRLLNQGSLEDIRTLVPPTTYAYLERM